MFNDLIKYYFDLFHEHGEPALKVLCNCAVPVRLILGLYEKLPAIETISEKEKSELWKYCSEIFPERSRDGRLEAAKVVYTVGTLL